MKSRRHEIKTPKIKATEKQGDRKLRRSRPIRINFMPPWFHVLRYWFLHKIKILFKRAWFVQFENWNLLTLRAPFTLIYHITGYLIYSVLCTGWFTYRSTDLTEMGRYGISNCIKTYIHFKFWKSSLFRPLWINYWILFRDITRKGTDGQFIF